MSETDCQLPRFETRSLTLRVLWGVCGTFVFVTCFQFSALGEIRSEMTPTSVVDRVIALFRWWTTPVWEGCGYGELPCLRGTFGLQVEAVALGQLPLLFFLVLVLVSTSTGARLTRETCAVRLRYNVAQLPLVYVDGRWFSRAAPHWLIYRDS